MTRVDEIPLNFDRSIGDRYQPVEWVGHGAMSHVLKARDRNAGDLPVAIKFLVPKEGAVADDNQRSLLRHEMEAMVRLHAHSYVVQVKDFGWFEDQMPYLVMDFMPGGSLKDRLSAGPLTPALQRRVLEELCDALDFIHEQGVAHLDLKPSNLFFDRGLHTRIGDFGIAQALERAYPDVVTAGTPGYMAPEQEDKQLPVDHRADIYALGIVTWQMLTRTLPEPDSLSDKRLHPELVKAVRRACSPDPSDRYHSAGAFWKSLRTWLPRRQVDGTTACPDFQFGSLLAQIPLTYRNRVRRVLEDYTAVFGGRDRELEALDEWLFDAEEPCGLLQAPAGRGKTALLANWAREMEHYGWHVVFHPISIRYETASMNATVRCLAHALAPLFNADPPGLNESPEVTQARIVEWLRHGMPEGEKLLLVVDGLDEAIGDYVNSLFPSAPGPRVKALVSARPLAGTDAQWWRTQLGWELALTTDFTLDQLGQADVVKILRAQTSDELNALSDDATFVQELERVTEGDPLTLKLIIDALRAAEITPESLSRRPPGLESYLEQWMRQLEEQAKSDTTWRLLSFCAVARGPLTAEDLAALAPDVFRSRRDIQQAVRPAERFILGEGTSESGYVFSHPQLQEYFKDRLLRSEIRACRQAFIAYGQRAFDQLPDRPSPPYVRQFWIAHLAAAEDFDRLRTCLLKRDVLSGKYIWAEMRFAAEGTYVGFLADTAKLWEHADRTHDIPTQIECALIQASTSTVANNMPLELLTGLVTIGTPEGRWSRTVALDYIRQMPTGQQRAKALEIVVENLAGFSDLEVFDIVKGIEDENARMSVIAGLSPHLQRAALTRIEQSCSEPSDKGVVSGGKPNSNPVPVFPESRCEKVIRKARREAERVELAAVVQRAKDSIQHEDERAHVLLDLIPFVAESGDPDLALELIEDLPDVLPAGPYTTYPKPEAIASVAPTFGSRLLCEALTVARGLEPGWAKARALAALALQFPTDQAQHILEEALSAHWKLGDRHWQLRASRALIQRLAQLGCPRDALNLMEKVGQDKWDAEALVDLIPWVQKRDRSLLAERALHAVQTVDSEWKQTEILSKLASNLPKPLLERSLSIVRQMEDPASRVEILTAIAPSLPEPERRNALAEALQDARAVQSKSSRLEAFLKLIPLESQEKAGALAEVALEAVKRIGVEEIWWPPYANGTEQRPQNMRLRALIKLAPRLPPSKLRTVLEETVEAAVQAARAIQSDTERFEALLGLLPFHPALESTSAAADALMVARTMDNGAARADALARIVPHLRAGEKEIVRAEALEAAEANGVLTILATMPEQLTCSQRAEVLDRIKQSGSEEFWGAMTSPVADWVPYLSDEDLEHALREAMKAACGDRDFVSRGLLLQSIAPAAIRLPPSRLYSLWKDSLHAQALQCRSDLLSDLAELAPVIGALGGPTAIKGAIQAILRAGAAWQ